MKLDGGLFLFAGLLVLIILASVMLGSYDTITPAVAHSQAELAVGPDWTLGISAGAGWLLKLALGGIFAGFGAAAFNWLRKVYKLWKRNAEAGRWQSGPNAYWQKAPSQQGPRLTKNDLMFMSLLHGRRDQGVFPVLPPSMQDEDDDVLDIDLYKRGDA